MSNIVFCNIAWMNRYCGITEIDQPMNGGSWVGENNDAMEAFNFLPYRGKCYGFVEHHGSALRLERVDKTATKASVLDDVTVVWVATGEEGSRIVGWYEKAEMHRECQEFLDGSCFYFVTPVETAYRIPVNKRNFEMPRASQNGKGRGMGQSNVWYADSEWAKEFYIPKVMEYLNEIRQDCRIVGFTAEERRNATAIPNKTQDELLELASTADNEGDTLRGLQILNQILVQDKGIGHAWVMHGLALEEMLCFDEAIEDYKRALENFTAGQVTAGLDIDCKEKLSRLYRITGKNFLAWHMEEKILEDYRRINNTDGMVESLLEMMSIAKEENDRERLNKLIADYDAIGTDHLADEVAAYRK